jgi:small-conductance mechanosensitive channel
MDRPMDQAFFMNFAASGLTYYFVVHIYDIQYFTRLEIVFRQ